MGDRIHRRAIEHSPKGLIVATIITGIIIIVAVFILSTAITTNWR
jgi:hypothetical protein